MKHALPLILILVGVVAGGCSSDSSSSPAAPAAAASAPADTGSFATAALTQAFRNADTATVQTVAGIVAAVGSKNYSAALSDLQKVAKIPGLTGEQETAVKQLLGQLTAKTGK